MSTITNYTNLITRTTTPAHLEGLSDTMLEYKLGAAEGNITHYMRMMDMWINALHADIELGIGTDISLDRLDANEELVNVNITAWYAIMGEMVMRRFRENGFYVAPGFDVESYVDGCMQAGSAITRTNVTWS